MARNEITVEASLRDTFAVLADPWSYGDWVVGAREIRDAEAAFPEPGSVFHHTQGAGPIGLKDSTSVIDAHPPGWLLLEVRVRPWLVAEVEFRLRSEDGAGTHVVMEERPIGGLLGRYPNPLLDVLVRVRNAETLRRLKRRAEGRGGASEPAPAAAAARR